MKQKASTEFTVAPVTRERLGAFLDLLLHWNRTVNLVSKNDEPRLWERHVWDSVQLADLLPAPPGPLLDLGSGAGFPGLVLALVTNRETHLVEVDQRKAAFLREAIRTTGASAVVHPARVETVSVPPAVVVTARGLGTLAKLLELSVPHLRTGGVCLFPKGRGVARELTAAGREWHMKVECFPSRIDPTATLLRLSNITRAAPPG